MKKMSYLKSFPRHLQGTGLVLVWIVSICLSKVLWTTFFDYFNFEISLLFKIGPYFCQVILKWTTVLNSKKSKNMYSVDCATVWSKSEATLTYKYVVRVHSYIYVHFTSTTLTNTKLPIRHVFWAVGAGKGQGDTRPSQFLADHLTLP